MHADSVLHNIFPCSPDLKCRSYTDDDKCAHKCVTKKIPQIYLGAIKQFELSQQMHDFTDLSIVPNSFSVISYLDWIKWLDKQSHP